MDGRIKKVVRVADVSEQDRLRRSDMRAMSPEERFLALMRLRDQAYEYDGLKKVFSVRELERIHSQED